MGLLDRLTVRASGAIIDWEGASKARGTQRGAMLLSRVTHGAGDLDCSPAILCAAKCMALLWGNNAQYMLWNRYFNIHTIYTRCAEIQIIDFKGLWMDLKSVVWLQSPYIAENQGQLFPILQKPLTDFQVSFWSAIWPLSKTNCVPNLQSRIFLTRYKAQNIEVCFMINQMANVAPIQYQDVPSPDVWHCSQHKNECHTWNIQTSGMFHICPNHAWYPHHVSYSLTPVCPAPGSEVLMQISIVRGPLAHLQRVSFHDTAKTCDMARSFRQCWGRWTLMLVWGWEFRTRQLWTASSLYGRGWCEALRRIWPLLHFESGLIFCPE